MAAGETEWYPAVGGLRALLTLSLIALHTVMLSSAHFTMDSSPWKAYVQHPLYGIFQAGGLQVDGLLLISGLLLGLSIRKKYASGYSGNPLSDAWRYARERAVRLWPVLFGAIAMQMLLGDSIVEDSRGYLISLVQILTFTNNLFDVTIHGSFTMTVAWSVCMTVQIGVVSLGVLLCLRKLSGSRRIFELLARILLVVAVAHSLYVRYTLWDLEDGNVVLLGVRPHFGNVQTVHSYKFMSKTFGWDLDRALMDPSMVHLLDEDMDSSHPSYFASINPVAEYAHRYLRKLYFPTMARYGPMMVGLLVAFFLQPHANLAPSTKPPGLVGAVCRTGLTLWAVATLSASCLTLDESNLPQPEAMMFATVALQVTSAAAYGALLFLSLSPVGSFWHSSTVSGFLGWSGWGILSRHSYHVCMFHFRIIMELTCRYLRPASQEQVDFVYTAKVYAMGLIFTLVYAFMVAAVEKPVQSVLRTVLLLPNKTTAGTKKKEQ